MAEWIRACWSAASRAISATRVELPPRAGRDFVIEGDEYDSAFFDKTAKFLSTADVAVINNVEFDHADIYADFDAVMLAFRRLVNLVPRRGLLLVGADSAGARAAAEKARSRVETFGTGDGLDWQAHDLEPAGAATRFKVRRGGSPFGLFDVPLVGAHNVRNALAAIAVATEAGVSAERIAEGLHEFAGVKRRLEVVGVADGVTVYDDFAHHPTAVAETLAGLRASNPDARIWAVFEPRSASSCRRVFQDDFAKAFAGADQVLQDVKILGGTGPGQSYFDPLAFRSVTDVRYGNRELNILRGPGVVNLDLGLFREFRVRDLQIQFRAEAFNATNTPHFNNPGSNVSSMRLNADGSVNTLGGYTEITSARPDERQVRLGLRVAF